VLVDGVDVDRVLEGGVRLDVGVGEGVD
jgi:hypothetical protein